MLRQIGERLGAVLTPWDFDFHEDKSGESSPGPYAAGFYQRGPLRLRLIYRSRGLGCVLYEREMVTERGYLRERITNGMFHTGYMRQIGHGGDCRLLEEGIDSRARDGGDPVDALIWDLREYAAPTLQQECDEFLEVIERGYRNYEVLKP